MADRPALPSLRRQQVETIEMVRNATGGFDAEAFYVMNKRDDQLIADEILNGAGSRSFVYSFKIKGKEVSGISVIGARHLAYHYQGLKHRIVASMEKNGSLVRTMSYPHEQAPMQFGTYTDHSDTPDFYWCLVEMHDLKTGNVIQIEQTEKRFETRDDGTQWEKPHLQKIAHSKAYRNAVLDVIPQDVKIRWQQQQLALKVTDSITDDVIGEKRKGVLGYATRLAIAVQREALSQLSMEQISALSDVAREKDPVRFREALGSLGLAHDEGNDGANDEEKGPPKGRGQKARTAAKGQSPSTQEGSKETGAHNPLDKETEQKGGQKSGGQPQTGRRSLFRDDD